MRKLLLLLGLAVPAFAQSNYLTITVSHGLVDPSGASLASGTFCAYATDGQDNPIPFLVGSTYQALKSTVCRAVVNGALSSSLTLANPAVTQPLNVRYHFVVTNTATRQATHYPGVSIVTGGSTWDFSSWNPATGSATIPVNVITGPQGPPGTPGTGSIAGLTSDGSNGIVVAGATNLSTDLPTGHQAASANAAVTTLSVLAFGAKADAVIGKSATLTASNPVISVPSATFTSADVGKYLVCTGWSSTPFSTEPYIAQITAFNTSTTVTISPTPLHSTSCTINYGTDNTVSFNACSAAVVASSSAGGICTIPAGSYFLATSPYYVVTGASDDGSYGQPAGGTGGTLTCTVSGVAPFGLSGCSVGAAGSGYSPSATLQTTISGGCGPQGYNGGNCGQAWVTATTNSSGQLSGATVVYAGFNFVSPPTVTVVKLGGDGATATATVSAGSINSTTVTAGGGGYAPSVSTLNVFGIGGTGCAPVAHANAGTIITAQGTATTNASGVVTSISMSNAGSGCSTPPALIFGDFACSNAQCSNIAPLVPFTIPVQIIGRARVSWRGMGSNNDSAVRLYSAWDGKSVSANEPAIFGGNFGSQGFSGIDFENYFIGMVGSNGFAVGGNSGGINFADLRQLTFGSNGGIGVWSKTLDLGTIISDINLNGRASWINGGQWSQRADSANAAAGYLNAESISNIITFGHPYDSVSIALDDWFGSNFWGVQYRSTSTFNAGETCKFPQTPTLRQTDLWITANPGANSSCYRGITGSGFVSYTQGGGGGTPIVNLTVKGVNRYIFQGDLVGSSIDTSSCENCVPIISDPYRNSATQESDFVFTVGTSFKNTGSAGAVQQALWDVRSAIGLPTIASWQGVTCLACSANPSYFGNTWLSAANTPQNESYYVGLAVPANGGRIANNPSGGIAFGGPSPGFTRMFLMAPAKNTSDVILDMTAGFRLGNAAPANHYVCGNGSVYADSSTPCIAAVTGTFTCTSGGTILVNNAGFLATSTVSFGIKTVGGTPGQLAQTTPVPATSFSVICSTGDTSTYNYRIH